MTDAAVLVTGANGLLGAAVIQRLSGAGTPVVGMDRTPPDPSLGSIPFSVADINDTHRLHATLRTHAIGSIVHCGAVSGRVAAGDNPFMLLETNVRGTAQLFEAARIHGIARVVLCSSAAAYGNVVPPRLTEDTPLRPTTVYGASKAAAEAILCGYAAQFGLDAVALRIFQVYGPRRTTPCYVRELISDALAGRETAIAHAPASRRQYVFVDDVADAIVLALEHPGLPRRAYNVCGDSSLTLAEVAQAVREVVPGVQVRFGDDPEGEQYRIEAVDPSLARDELRYAPKVSLAAGIARYAAWLQERAA